MSNEIVVRQPSIIQSFSDLERVASAMAQSGFFTDSRDATKAIVKVMAGHELGIGPFASMTGINIIQGKPALGANVVATLVKNDPRYNYRIKQCDANVCTLVWFENGEAVGETSFTMQEAKDAGLTGKDNWKKYPSDMLFARAITRGARRHAPGIFGGAPVYTPEELGADTDEEGYITHAPTIEVINHHVPDGVPFDPLPFELQLVIEAGQMTTPKGTRLMDLEPDQLSMVVDKSKGTLGDAAELLLNLATEAALAAFVEVGGDPLPETTTNLELVNAYYALDQA